MQWDLHQPHHHQFGMEVEVEVEVDLVPVGELADRQVTLELLVAHVLEQVGVQVAMVPPDLVIKVGTADLGPPQVHQATNIQMAFQLEQEGHKAVLLEQAQQDRPDLKDHGGQLGQLDQQGQ
jgi:DNA polymerase III psi subunit